MQNFNAKLSDFGLARDGPDGTKTHVSTGVVGTMGYLAPEYLCKGALLVPSLCPVPFHALCLYHARSGSIRLDQAWPG